jgi:hypothetical protein
LTTRLALLREADAIVVDGGPPKQILVGAIRTCMGSVGAMIRERQEADGRVHRGL